MHDLVPLVMFPTMFAMIFGIVYLKSRENMAMIEKGLNPKEFANRPAPYRNLKWGLLLIGAGLGMLVAFFVDFYMPVTRDVEPGVIYCALIGIGGGLGLVGSYKIEKKELLDNRDNTGGGNVSHA